MEHEVTVESVQKLAFEYPSQRLLVYAAQIMILPILLFLRLLIVRNNLYRPAPKSSLYRTDHQTSYILYGNHQSKFDALLVTASLPLKTIRQLMPFHFFVENSYFKGSLGIFLNLMGGFPAHYDANRAYGLDKARELIELNQTVVIFPSGARTRKHVAKLGISVLAMDPTTRLIPIHLDWKGRWRCHVHIGSPMKGGGTKSPAKLMQQVYALPRR